MQSPPPAVLDHFVWIQSDRDLAAARLAEALGASPIPGGRHPNAGTWNALLGLGAVYLEILAPDPHRAGGTLGETIATRGAEAGTAWCWRRRDLETFAARCRLNGFRVHGPEDWSRQTGNGDELRWRLLFVDHPHSEGLLPFFIDWGATPPPSATLAPLASLEHIRLLAQSPARLSELLEALDVTGAQIEYGAPALIARVSNLAGAIDLAGEAFSLFPPQH